MFTRDDGRPMRPQTVLNRFRKLTDSAGVPRITMHDMRHFASTTAISAGVPLVVVSKTLRHDTVSTTANIYSHLIRPAARAAVLAIQDALATAQLNLTRAAGTAVLLWQGADFYTTGLQPAVHPADIDGVGHEPEATRGVRNLVSAYFSKTRSPAGIGRQRGPRLLIQ
ncbi:tyrosine-type recombinase/integrase [Yinghuangia sp. KLBMP8922]|uniref:Tyrosine-type recombinase/integrase n=1 Tax=Yinghuangia soli TaxID=2908204 RepID=A0AA41Q8N4_9ACTN|nr:tyrosine-type recombinase/integrase [Yinghuangia soli]